MFYCMFYFTCDRSLSETEVHCDADIPALVAILEKTYTQSIDLSFELEVVRPVSQFDSSSSSICPVHTVDSDATQLSSRVGGVNAPVSSCDPVYNFLCC